MGTDYAAQDRIRSERRDSFTAKLPAIARALAALEPDRGWTVQPEAEPDRYRFPHLTSTAGDEIWFGMDEYKNKIEVHGSYPKKSNGAVWIPRDHKYDAPSEKIGFSADREPAAIAREIVRRFLPLYREYLQAANDSLARQLSHEQLTRQTFEQLLKDAPGLLRPWSTRAHEIDHASELRATGDGIDVTVSGSDVRLKVNLSGDFARTVLGCILQSRKAANHEG